MTIDELVTNAYYKIEQIRQKVKDVTLEKFPSGNPLELSKLVLNICDGLKSYLQKLEGEYVESPTDVERDIKLTILFLCEIASHLRFVDAAAVKKTPQRMILPLEKLVQKILPIKIITRSQWHYNYGLWPEIDKEYFEALEYKLGYKHPLGKVELEKIFEGYIDEKGRGKLYVMSFPAFEQENLLLHANFGHEIGHRFAKEFLELEKKDESYLRGIITGVLEHLEILKIQDMHEMWRQTFTKMDEIKKQANSIRAIRSRGLEEIISDLASLYIFGSASIFASEEYSQIFESIDRVSSPPDYYPPWRFRLRVMLVEAEPQIRELLMYKSENPIHRKIIKGLSRKVDSLVKLVSEEKDNEEINRDFERRTAYESLLTTIPQVKSFLKQELSQHAYTSEKMIKEVLPLCERIHNHIPPNATEDDPFNPKIADFRAIINAGWLYRISYLSDLHKKPEEFLKQMGIINRLLLKAVELSYIHEEYKNRVKTR